MREVRAGQPLGEAEVVLDGRALPGLAAGCVPLDDHRLEPLGRGVHGGGETGGAGTDDAEVVERPLRPGAQPERIGQLDRGGGPERDTVGQRHHGQVVDARLRQVEETGRLLALVHLQPAVGDVVVGEEGLDVVGALRPPVPDDPHLGLAVGVGVGPVAQQLVEHRVEPVLGRVPRLHQVVVEGDVVDRADGDVRVGVRRQQHQLGVGRLLPHLPQHLDARHPGHPLVGDDRGDGSVLEDEVGQDLERLRPDVARSTRWSSP